jgi:Fe-S cluster assembly protein SufD
VFNSTPSGAPSISHPRTLVLAEENSQATIVETYTGGGTYFTNAVTEVIADDGAVVDHYKLELESPDAFHIATMQSRQGARSNLSTHAISLGGKLVRNEVNALLAGEEGEATVNGFYLTDCEQHIDNHTLIEHAEPNCNSHELYKGILGGRSSGVFRGKIHVHRKAQETDAYQSNQSLLISENAGINTKPQLEIYADQVKCSHGATIGQLDQNAVFYLRSRGLRLPTAQRILAHAFAVDILNRIKPDSVRNYLERIVMDKFERAQGAGNMP